MRFTTASGSYGRTPARRIICAAAFGSLSGSSSSWAFFVPPPPPRPYYGVRPPFAVHSSGGNPKSVPLSSSHTRQHRTLFSRRDDDDNGGDSDWETFKKSGANLMRKGADKVKSFLPSFLRSKDEKRADVIRREREGEISGGINAMLKDMPLPVRALGRIVSPLLARAAEEMAEQSRQAQDILEEARLRSASDPDVVETLGEPVRAGRPFSQSSSSISINGRTTTTVKASFPVTGKRGEGIATMESSDGEIRSLTVNVNGRNISVGSRPRRGGSAYGKSSSTNDGNVIEAEIIEKK
ncbi:hypothetical protein ACHAW5_010568 [Stephanodiscus triporus]|uniref:Uncharacterized protein n=1 Tax=Stephanodiscus triporus TaxID=2934178 RepID=A0ABD3PL24_9STRA